MAEDDMVRDHHRFSGHEFEQTPADSKGQGSLVCCTPWGHKELDITQSLNNIRLGDCFIFIQEKESLGTLQP